MLKAIILEDDEDSRELLAGYLHDVCPQVRLAACCHTVAEAYDAIRQSKPDLVFLDIELKGETSFDLLARFQSTDFDLIFTTAHENYMLRAIRLSAIDYLLKPINPEELKAAVGKVEQRMNDTMLHKSVEALMHNLRGNNKDQKIAVSATDGYIFIRISDIVYLRSEGAYTFFYLKQGDKIVTCKNIKEYEELLNGHNFFRIHKSYIVNVSEIHRYVRGDGGTVIMSDRMEIDVSRRRKDEFMQLLQRA